MHDDCSRSKLRSLRRIKNIPKVYSKSIPESSPKIGHKHGPSSDSNINSNSGSSTSGNKRKYSSITVATEAVRMGNRNNYRCRFATKPPISKVSPNGSDGSAAALRAVAKANDILHKRQENQVPWKKKPTRSGFTMTRHPSYI